MGCRFATALLSPCPLVALPPCRSIRSDRLFLCFYRMQQASSSSKNAHPSLRSLSRICNVFLTKMDVLLPATFSMNSLPDLLLLVNAEQKMPCCRTRITGTARPIFFPHAQSIEKRVTLWYNCSVYLSDTHLTPHVVSESGIFE